jgi:hypothetical protein
VGPPSNYPCASIPMPPRARPRQFVARASRPLARERPAPAKPRSRQVRLPRDVDRGLRPAAQGRGPDACPTARGMAILAMTLHGRDAPATAGETPALPPPEPRKGRKKSRPKATAHEHFSWAAARALRRKLVARMDSFPPPGLGGLYSNSSPIAHARARRVKGDSGLRSFARFAGCGGERVTRNNGNGVPHLD